MLKYRTLKFVFWLLLLYPALGNALSLGEIKVYSNFAQPFWAEIDIPSYNSDELESLEISLANAEKFETLGLEILPYMEELIFKLEEKPNGTPFIKIYTKKPLKELSISFVIEVSWVGGKIVKDYHTLLTPEAISELREEQLMQRQLAQVDAEPQTQKAPTKRYIDERTSPPAFTPVDTRMAQAPQEPLQANSESKPEKSSKVKKFGANGVEYTRVESGETLTKVAMQIKADTTASMHQVMVALFQQNQKAFINNNMNNLKAGAKLTIEDLDDVQKISKNEAYALAQQYLSGSKVQQTAETTIDDATEAPAKEFDNKGNRLEIAGVSEEPVPAEIIEKLKQEQIASTEQELQIAKKNAEQLQMENSALRERIAAMELDIEALNTKVLAAEENQVADSAPHDASATQQTENMLVTETNLTMNDTPQMSIMEQIAKHQTPLSIGGVSLLSLALLLVRKKNKISEAIANYQDKSGKKSSRV